MIGIWSELQLKIRSSVQAIIIHEGKLLTLKKYDYNKFMNILPGGGQEPGETLKEAVIRECREEIGVKVEVNELLFVSEYIGKNHEHAQWDSKTHVVVHLFSCTVPSDLDKIGENIEPDPDQIGIEWIPMKELSNSDFYPKAMIPILLKYETEGDVIATYVGDMG